MKRKAGAYLTCSGAGEEYRAYMPAPLAPEPPLALDAELETLRDKANRALGRLDGITDILPDTRLFLYQYVRKEALLSSQIEGTQSSFSDLLLFELEEAPGVPVGDVQEVSNYVAALEYGLKRLRDGFPLSLRLLREIHGILLSEGRGSNKTPGEFRRSQNWLGGTRPGNAVFVPPPPERLMDCLGPFEKFLHDDPVPTPVLLKAALAHVQFETIHPFLDGNGRLGRLLITFLLCNEGVLREPSLYLSLYFKIHRAEYYDRLQSVRIDGDWEGWLRFFLTGVSDSAQQAVSAARSLLTLFEHDRQRIQQLGRGAGTAARLLHLLEQKPIVSIPSAAKSLELSRPTATGGLERLQALGIVRELTGKRRNRMFVYDEYLRVLSEGTEPIPK